MKTRTKAQRYIFFIYFSLPSSFLSLLPSHFPDSPALHPDPGGPCQNPTNSCSGQLAPTDLPLTGVVPGWRTREPTLKCRANRAASLLSRHRTSCRLTLPTTPQLSVVAQPPHLATTLAIDAQSLPLTCVSLARLCASSAAVSLPPIGQLPLPQTRSRPDQAWLSSAMPVVAPNHP